MINVFHGDDLERSRRMLFNETSKFTGVHAFLTKEINQEVLYKLRGLLFKTSKEAIILEGFFSLNPVSVKKLVPTIQDLETTFEIYLWENKKIAPTKLALLGKRVNILFFPLPTTIFKFLDIIGSRKIKEQLSLFNAVLKSNSPEIVHYLTARRVRDLLNAKETPKTLKGAPWQKGQLLGQVKFLALDQIKKMYLELIEIEFKNKTGKLGNELTNAFIDWAIEYA